MRLDLGGLECFRCIPKRSRKALSDEELVRELRLGSDLMSVENVFKAIYPLRKCALAG